MECEDRIGPSCEAWRLRAVCYRLPRRSTRSATALSVDEKARALREDQTTLNALAIEMRQSRFREMQDRNEQAEMLSATWTKQKALKDMERALGKK